MAWYIQTAGSGFIENISNQLFFAIFVNAEKNLFCLEVLLEYFSAAFFRFFAPVEYYDPRNERIVPSIFRYIILEESARPTGSSTVLEKIFSSMEIRV